MYLQNQIKSIKVYKGKLKDSDICFITKDNVVKNLISIKILFNLFIIIYFLSGLILSINVGITHDESHGLYVWELNKKN